MKKLFLHIKRLFKKFWFIIFFFSAISLVFGLGLVIIMTAISLLFFNDPVDINAILDSFTERELEIVLSENMDDSVNDDEYLTLVARYQSLLCPKKVDSVTTWVSSEVTNEAYIYEYELKKEPNGFNVNILKNNIMSSINKNSVQARRMVTSNRDMVFRYYNRSTNETFDIRISCEELKG